MSKYFRELTLNLQQADLYSITDEQGRCLQSTIDQIELSIPNLGELLDQEQNIEVPEDSGIQFS